MAGSLTARSSETAHIAPFGLDVDLLGHVSPPASHPRTEAPHPARAGLPLSSPAPPQVAGDGNLPPLKHPRGAGWVGRVALVPAPLR